MEPINLKLVVVGDGVVGKTCLLSTYAHNQFPKEYVPTVFDSTSRTVKIDGTIINLSLWDTAGQQQYQKLRPLAYPSTDIFLIIFSVVAPSSCINAKKKWYPQVHNVTPSALKIFVGNKIDLRQTNESVQMVEKTQFITKSQAQKVFEQQLKCKYYECSALTRAGINELFEGAVRFSLRRLSQGKVLKEGIRQNKSDVCCQIM